MESVHGISVTGGSFPAQIWRLFMSSAIGGLEPLSFPEPRDWPEWKEFVRETEDRSFGYGYDEDDDYAPPASTPETTEEEDEEPTPSEPPGQAKKEDDVPLAPPASQPLPKPTPPPPTTPSE